MESDRVLGSWRSLVLEIDEVWFQLLEYSGWEWNDEAYLKPLAFECAAGFLKHGQGFWMADARY